MSNLKDLEKMLKASIQSTSNDKEKKDNEPSFFWKQLTLTSILNYNPRNLYSDLKAKSQELFASMLKALNASVTFLIKGNVANDDVNSSQVLSFVSRPLWIGIYIIILFPICGIAWLYFAPVGKAVITSGQIKCARDNQIIEAPTLEGGVKIKKIHVNEGDLVEPNQLLIELDDTNTAQILKETTKSILKSYTILAHHRAFTNIKELAEIDCTNNENLENVIQLIQNAKMEFDKEAEQFISENKCAIPNLMQEAEVNFNILKINILDQLNSCLTNNKLYRQKIDLLNDKSNKKNQFIRKEDILEVIKIKSDLYKEGLISFTEYVEKKRELTHAMDALADQEHAIMHENLQLVQHQQKTSDMINRILTNSIENINRYQDSLFQNKAKYSGLKNSLEKTKIYSHIKGVVNKVFKKHTDILLTSLNQQPYLMEIIPTTDYYIYCNIPSQSLGSIKKGMQVKIQFVTFAQKINRDFLGVIDQVGYDIDPASAATQQKQKFYDHDDGQKQPQGPMFSVRIKFNLEELKQHIENYQDDYIFSSGMVAQLFIKKPDESYLSYIIAPFTNSVKFQFKE